MIREALIVTFMNAKNRLYEAGAMANYPSMTALQEGTLDVARLLTIYLGLANLTLFR